MSDILPDGTGLLIAFYIVVWTLIAGVMGVGIGWLLWG